MKKEYYIKMKNGQKVPVSEEIYREYKQPVWREAKRKNIRKEREISLDFMAENGLEYMCTDKQKLTEEIVADKLMLEMLMKALKMLTDDERRLIDEIYYNEKSERNLSKQINVPQQTINSRKTAIIKKLRKFMKL